MHSALSLALSHRRKYDDPCIAIRLDKRDEFIYLFARLFNLSNMCCNEQDLFSILNVHAGLFYDTNALSFGQTFWNKHLHFLFFNVFHNVTNVLSNNAHCFLQSKNIKE